MIIGICLGIFNGFFLAFFRMEGGPCAFMETLLFLLCYQPLGTLWYNWSSLSALICLKTLSWALQVLNNVQTILDEFTDKFKCSEYFQILNIHLFLFSGSKHWFMQCIRIDWRKLNAFQTYVIKLLLDIIQY